MKKLIVANWKMNPKTASDVLQLVRSFSAHSRIFSRVELVLCPPFVYLPIAKGSLKGISAALGAQNISEVDAGLHTGEVSASMVKSVGAAYVILGHSERRAMGETDELIHEKVLMALASGLIPVIAVGEVERTEDAHQIIAQQLKKILHGISRRKAQRIIFAYEPRWAISKGIHDTKSSSDAPESAHEKMIYIRRMLAHRYGAACANATAILYGGSVRAKNIRSFLVGNPSFDGALVGGASLNTKAFIELVRALL